MLQELVIRDFAIIANLQVSFEDGMTVLTGETGAGKSIVIDALSLLMGARGSGEFIRTGAKKCQLQALFSLPKENIVWNILEDLGLPIDDGELIIQRDLLASGKNVCRINGMLVNTNILRQVGQYLVDIQGQNDQQLLLQAENHISLLDNYAKLYSQPCYKKYQETYYKYLEVKKKLDQRKMNEQAYVQRVDMLSYQIQEIEDANLEIGEEEKLKEEKNLFDNYLNIMEQLNTSSQALNDEESGALNALSVAMSAINDIAGLSKNYENISEIITNAYYSLQDVSSEIASEQDMLEFDEERMQYVEERLSDIYQLERKYGEDIDSILQYLQDIKEEYQSLTFDNQSLEDLQKLVDNLYKELEKYGQEMSKIRHRMAQQLSQAIDQELAELYMEQAHFEVKFIKNTTLDVNGIEKVEFYMITNAGESLKPLSKIVSGGELSRIILALKTIFTDTREITSIVFDEVDTGVSGRVAQAIANKIHQIGEKSQVLCITHLPQVAAIADHHYYIQKEIIDDRTEMHLTLLNDSQKVKEVARMLSGVEMTELTLEHAEELISMLKKEG